MKSRGFTLVELVVVILVLGVLAAYAAPKFFNLDLYRDRAAYDEVTSAVRYAQKLAVSSGCDVQVQLTTSAYALKQHATSCTVGSFTTISSQHLLNTSSFSDVSISPAVTFVFDAMGRSSANVNVTVGSFHFSVVAETGYVDSE